MAAAAGAAENPELLELKSIIKSFVISAEGNATIARIGREYEEMEGRSIPFQQFGTFRSLAEFLKSALFQNEFYFSSNRDGSEVLRPKADEKTAHIQDLVMNQRHDRKKKRKPTNKFSALGRGAPRSSGPGGTSFNFHAAGMGRVGFHSNSVRSAAARPNPQFRTNTGFALRSTAPPSQQQQQPPVRPLAAQQNNMQQPVSHHRHLQQQQQQLFSWPSPIKAQTPAGATNISSSVRPAIQQTSTPIAPVASQAPSLTFAKWDWEQTDRSKQQTAASATGRTVVTNFSAQKPSVTVAVKSESGSTARSLVKVCTEPAQSFKASIARPGAGRGIVTGNYTSSQSPGVSSIQSQEQLDKVHWLRVKCLQTFYYVRREAGTTGVSIGDFSAKFFQMHKVFLVGECEKLTGSDDTVRFLENSFANRSSKSPISPASDSSSADSQKTVELTSNQSYESSGRLLKVVDNKTLLFNRKKFRFLVQYLNEMVVSASIPNGKIDRKKELPDTFVPKELEDQVMKAVGQKYATRPRLAALLVHWFFNRFLPSSQSGDSITVPRNVTSFTEEMRIFAQQFDQQTFSYSLFPVPSDVDEFIGSIDADELSDPEHLISGDAGSLKWVPVNLCSVLSPNVIYVTRVKEQATLNLLSEEMHTFYELSEGKGAEYQMPVELLVPGQLVAVSMRARLTTTSRRVYKAEDQDGDGLECRWTRAFITRGYNSEERCFIAHLIDMGCGMRFRDARFLVRDRFLDKSLAFDKGFAVPIALLGITPPVSVYTQQVLSNPSLMPDIPITEMPDHLASKGFPVEAVSFIQTHYANKQKLTAAFFSSKRRGVRYEALIADVTSNDADEFLTETLCSKGLAEQLAIEDAMALLTADLTIEQVLKKKIMQDLMST